MAVRSRWSRRYRNLLMWLGHRGLFTWLGPHVFAPVDAWLYPRVHGAVVSAGPPVLPLLMLTTARPRTNKPHSVPLVYLERGTDLLVVASNWGRDRHPGWSENLLAEPSAIVQIGRRRQPVYARLATPVEKASLWPELIQLCPVWQSYEARSGRDLRVFVLTTDNDRR